MSTPAPGCRSDVYLPRRRVRTTRSHSVSPATAGRRLDDGCPLCRRTDAGRHPLPCRARPDRPTRHLPVLAGAGPSALTLDELVASGTVPRTAAPPARGPRRRPARFRDHRRHRQRQDDPADALLSMCRPERAHRPRRGRGRAASATPACGRPRGPAAERRGRRRDRLRDLVRQALRMRPDRLVVGEVRGAEVVDLLAAMNTGHEGWLQHGARQLRRATCRRASRRWGSPRACGATRCTRSSPLRSTSCFTCGGIETARRRLDDIGAGAGPCDVGSSSRSGPLSVSGPGAMADSRGPRCVVAGTPWWSPGVVAVELAVRRSPRCWRSGSRCGGDA